VTTVERRSREFPPVFDGHEDFIYAILHPRDVPGGVTRPRRRRDFLADGAPAAEGDVPYGHVDLPRALRGGLGGSFTSIYLTTEEADIDPLAHAMRCINELLQIVDRSDGRVRLCRTAAEVRAAFDADAFASVIAFEGADPISWSLKELRVFYEAGLRCLAPTWSRSTIFAHGVAFSGSLPDTGLTEKGRELVAECNRLGIVLDVSHINRAGFWDMLQESQQPVIATHSSVHAISPHVRNLDDEQIRALAAQGGTMGINFSNGFLRPDMNADGANDTPLEVLLDHFDHVVNLVGDEHVSFGTDFDGTDVPSAVRDASLLPVVLRGLQARGYSDDALERICHGNFLRVAREVWGA
jgi:membrane dipeptidase